MSDRDEDGELPRPPFDFEYTGLKSVSDFLETERNLFMDAMLDFVHKNPDRDIFKDAMRYSYQAGRTVEQAWSSGHAYGGIRVLERKSVRDTQTHILLEELASHLDTEPIPLQELRQMYTPGKTIGPFRIEDDD